MLDDNKNYGALQHRIISSEKDALRGTNHF
jgi:hypothetical protein